MPSPVQTLARRLGGRGARAVAVCLALLLVLPPVVAACGEEELMERPEDPRLKRGGKKKKKKGGGSPDDLVVINVKKPQWDLISSHYKKFLAQKHTTPKDSFKPQVLKFIPKPTLTPPEDLEPEIDAIEDDEPRGPLQQYPLKDYGLLLIMSGTAVPKAVVTDPKGQAYVIQRDTRIGDTGGIIESITQYMVVVREPNEEQPVKMTIKPPYIDLVSQIGFDLDESDFDEEFAVPPSLDGADQFPGVR